MIIDEEQRFGVEHKDTLKKLKTNVDILAMSATPIPRTLEMAVTGIREMSTLQTPPEDRHPILSYVGPRNDKQIAAAIRRELLREGQVFFVHNRVQSIQRVAVAARRARARGAHRRRPRPDGRARARGGRRRVLGAALRRARLHDDRRDRPRHLEREHDHHRPRRQVRPLAAAPAARPRRARARARLRVLPVRRDEAALRDGRRPARDDRRQQRPRQRHAGRAEGPRAARRGQPARRRAGRPHRRRRLRPVPADDRRGRVGVPRRRGRGPAELRLELPVQARIPESYIDSERLRLEAYQKLSAAASASAKDDALDLVIDELRDRYGEPPADVEGLLAVARLRRRAAQAGLVGRRRDGAEPADRAGEPARLDARAAAAPLSDGQAARRRRRARRAAADGGRRARRRRRPHRVGRAADRSAVAGAEGSRRPPAGRRLAPASTRWRDARSHERSGAYDWARWHRGGADVQFEHLGASPRIHPRPSSRRRPSSAATSRSARTARCCTAP